MTDLKELARELAYVAVQWPELHGKDDRDDLAMVRWSKLQYARRVGLLIEAFEPILAAKFPPAEPKPEEDAEINWPQREVVSGGTVAKVTGRERPPFVIDDDAEPKPASTPSDLLNTALDSAVLSDADGNTMESLTTIKTEPKPAVSLEAVVERIKSAAVGCMDSWTDEEGEPIAGLATERFKMLVRAELAEVFTKLTGGTNQGKDGGA